MQIVSKLTNAGADIFYNPDFRHVLEDHLELLRNDTRNDVFVVTTRESEKFKGDFYGFLKLKDVSPQHYWITLRVNRMDNPNQFTGFTSVTVPSEHALREIKQMYEATS